MNATGLPFKGADMADHVYIDIETVPTQDDDVKAEIAAGIKPPASMSKPETIAKWEAEQKSAAVAEAVAKTALDGGYGHVVCIGAAVNDGPAWSEIIPAVSSEKSLISSVFDRITKSRDIRNGATVIVGHNVAEFDLRFLWQRACVLGIAVPPWFPRDPKPWSESVHDTMVLWAGRNGRIGLDRLARIFGVPGKMEGISGADVGRVWASGDLSRIATYCRDDVETTRSIHQRMLVAMGG